MRDDEHPATEVNPTLVLTPIQDAPRGTRLRLIFIGLAGLLLLVLSASQLFLPGYLERRIENRLTADGGSASVTLEALPALRLLAHDGNKLSIAGHGLVFAVRLSDLGSRSLRELDGFDEVEIRLVRLRAGPFQARDFVLTRPEDASSYHLKVSATTSARALVTYGSARLPGLLAPLVGGTAGALIQERGRIPLDVDAELTSDAGRPRIVSARGTVAGLQVGPLVELLAGAVLSRL
jgi:hypothetical protein